MRNYLLLKYLKISLKEYVFVLLSCLCFLFVIILHQNKIQKENKEANVAVNVYTREGINKFYQMKKNDVRLLKNIIKSELKKEERSDLAIELDQSSKKASVFIVIFLENSKQNSHKILVKFWWKFRVFSYVFLNFPDFSRMLFSRKHLFCSSRAATKPCYSLFESVKNV